MRKNCRTFCSTWESTFGPSKRLKTRQGTLQARTNELFCLAKNPSGSEYQNVFPTVDFRFAYLLGISMAFVLNFLGLYPVNSLSWKSQRKHWWIKNQLREVEVPDFPIPCYGVTLPKRLFIWDDCCSSVHYNNYHTLWYKVFIPKISQKRFLKKSIPEHPFTCFLTMPNVWLTSSLTNFKLAWTFESECKQKNLFV